MMEKRQIVALFLAIIILVSSLWARPDFKNSIESNFSSRTAQISSDIFDLSSYTALITKAANGINLNDNSKEIIWVKWAHSYKMNVLNLGYYVQGFFFKDTLVLDHIKKIIFPFHSFW